MRTTRYALLLAGGYALLAAIYIMLSSRIAARLSATVEELGQIEQFKGIVFVAVTALAVFAGARFALSRIERSAAALRARDQALLANERRVFAGLLAASIAHDANNVLQVAIADLHGLREALGGDDRTVKRLEQSVDRLVSLNQRLLRTARQRRLGEPEDLDLARVVADALAIVGAHDKVSTCQLRFADTAPLVVRTHPLLIHQIVSNLVVNAAEAVSGRGTIEVRLAPRGAGAVLEVHDSGPGVPPDRRAALFDSLETTKPDGSGLGLFSVKSCAAALGGSVEVADSPLGGACFRVVIAAPVA